ncbi:MAG: lactate utilization protein [Spirochaetia bacterium]|jgi:L-lactate utilization protein LutC
MDFDTPATTDRIEATMVALKARGITAELLQTREEALARLQTLIPAGASLSTGASLSLKEIGFEELLVSGSHPWRNLKSEYLAEKDPARQTLLRRQSTLADYFLGSVHAVSQTGELVIASMTGSQLSPYAYAASNLIWVVGAQKITASLEEAVRRVREYVLPHEDKRMREFSGGRTGSMIGKLLIFEREAPFLNRKVSLLFVRQRTGD